MGTLREMRDARMSAMMPNARPKYASRSSYKHRVERWEVRNAGAHLSGGGTRRMGVHQQRLDDLIGGYARELLQQLDAKVRSRRETLGKRTAVSASAKPCRAPALGEARPL